MVKNATQWDFMMILARHWPRVDEAAIAAANSGSACAWPSAQQRLRGHPGVELGLALLDQRIMAGVGNLYKTEMCFLLGLSPWVPVREVDPDAVVALARQLLLANADRPEQSTTGELARGKQHWVYERAGKPCRRCGARVIRAAQGDEVHARNTYYCPRCQPGPHPPP